MRELGSAPFIRTNSVWNSDAARLLSEVRLLYDVRKSNRQAASALKEEETRVCGEVLQLTKFADELEIFGCLHTVEALLAHHESGVVSCASWSDVFRRMRKIGERRSWFG
jgi:hypothetical protein